MLIVGLAIVAYLSRRSRILRRVGVPANEMARLGGGIHCITQQVPGFKA